MRFIVFFISLLICNISFSQNLDVIYLKDKTTLSGKVLKVTPEIIEIDVSGDSQPTSINRKDVNVIVYSDNSVVVMNNDTEKPDIFEEGVITDSRDGKQYKTKKIGNQIWMIDDLNYKMDNGSLVYGFYNPNTVKETTELLDEFGLDPNIWINLEPKGKLYTWKSALSACPKGWHLPTDEEWKVLTDFLGGDKVAGGKMKLRNKEKGQIWREPNKGATNSSGFSGYPEGVHAENKSQKKGELVWYWSSTENSGEKAFIRGLLAEHEDLARWGLDKKYFITVRCVKD